MTEQQPLAPKLRFQGFTDAWTQRKFGDVNEVVPSNTLSRADLNYDDGQIKNIHYGDVLIKFGAVLDADDETLPFITAANATDLPAQHLHDGDIVFADAAEDSTVGKATEVRGINTTPVVAGLHTIVARPTVAFGNSFLGYYVNSPAFRNRLLPLMQGVKVLSLSRTNLNKTKANFPSSIEEQDQIGQMLRTLDEIIALRKRKLGLLRALKAGLLEQLFPIPWHQTARIRFAGFSEPWQPKSLGSISSKVSRKNVGSEYGETFTNSAQLGIVSQRDYFDKDISNAANLATYYVVQPNDFVYNPRISQFAPVGPIKRNNLQRTGVMSPLYYVFRIHGAEPRFLESYFECAHWHTFMKENGDNGVRADRFNIKDSLFEQMPIPLPSPLEQKLIGTLFSAVDTVIAAQQRQLDKAIGVKKVLLEQMFL